MELTYHRKGDYLFPNLTVEEEEVTIGKYGMLRRTFLKEHKNSLYQSLFLTGKLNSHLEQIEKAAQERMDSQMEKTAGEESGTGQGSRSDGMDSTYERTDGNSGREHLDGIGIQLVEDTREDGFSKSRGRDSLCFIFACNIQLQMNKDGRSRKGQLPFMPGEILIPEDVVDEMLRDRRKPERKPASYHL